MLAVETTHDWAWSVTITVPTYAPATYANTVASAMALRALVAWANDAARPWYGHGTFSWTWVRNTGAADTTQGGALLTLSCTTAFTLASGDSRFVDSTGISPDTGVTSIVGTSSALGTWAPVGRLSVRGHARLLASGDAGGANLIRPGVPGLAGYSPTVGAVGTAQDASRLAVVLASASNPRRGTVYQLHRDTWLTLALGSVDRAPVDFTHYAFTLHAAGESV